MPKCGAVAEWWEVGGGGVTERKESRRKTKGEELSSKLNRSNDLNRKYLGYG